MSMTDSMPGRRKFLQTGALALQAGFPAVLSAQSAQPIKVGLVGCGGRGTGAAAQALKADDYAELTAVADVYQERIDSSLERLRRAAGPKVKVEKEKQFVGLHSYQDLIASGVDVVLLATPPGFRPQHLRACIEAGKHVFCEKPVAVDSPGVRNVLESAALAKQKNLSLVSGFCWRYSNQIRATMDQLRNGAIGAIVGYYATYYTSPVKPMPPADTRPAGISDVEWQISHWYNFSWLSGDGLVEQAVHSVDKIAWAFQDADPVSCVAVGGRQIPAHGGNIFDHFEVNYLFPNGARAFMGCRQIENCYNENADYIMGSKGQITIGRGPLPRITGEKTWSFEGARNDMYQAEHDALFASIRQGKPLNDGVWMAHSTLLAIMGRMAAYTGQQVTWEQALHSNELLTPLSLAWDGSLTVPGLPRPGVTQLL
ncbi:MAG: Gfo/Idh/MocA family oxidoreductase [Acidimicrobiia bacterium]|nr:Gfo/Idh/MocA family oxidoreductase [Acidimicrobiia bacterium]